MGSIFYAIIINHLLHEDCKHIEWVASPYNLFKHQSAQAMLPHLIKFYGQLGATSAYYDGKDALHHSDHTTTPMIITDILKARRGIYLILEKTIACYNNPSFENNSAQKAIGRAAIITKHITESNQQNIISSTQSYNRINTIINHIQPHETYDLLTDIHPQPLFEDTCYFGPNETTAFLTVLKLKVMNPNIYMGHI